MKSSEIEVEGTITERGLWKTSRLKRVYIDNPNLTSIYTEPDRHLGAWIPMRTRAATYGKRGVVFYDVYGPIRRWH